MSKISFQVIVNQVKDYFNNRQWWWAYRLIKETISAWSNLKWINQFSNISDYPEIASDRETLTKMITEIKARSKDNMTNEHISQESINKLDKNE